MEEDWKPDRHIKVYVDDDGCISEPIGQWADGEDRLPNHHNTWHLVYDSEAPLPEGRADGRETDLDQAHDWLIQWAMAQRPDVVSHYWHMSDGQHWACGCPLEGEEDPR